MKYLKSICLGFALLNLIGCSKDSGVIKTSSNPIDCQVNENLNPALKSLVDTFFTTNHAPGVAVLISSPTLGRNAYFKGYAVKEDLVPVSSNTLWHTMSVGKSFTAAAILALVEQGTISLDQSLASWGVAIPNHASGPVTFRMALNHTSLLERPFNTKLSDPNFRITTDPTNTKEKHLLDALDLGWLSGTNCCTDPDYDETQVPGGFQLGSTPYYSDANSTALAIALEKITGKTWNQAIRDLVMKPWNLSESFFLSIDVPENPASYISPYLRAKKYESFTEDPAMPPRPLSDQFLQYASGAGTVISSVCDLERFSTAFYKGSQLSSTIRTQQLNYVIDYDNGRLGLGVQGDTNLHPKLEYIGHFGGGPGGGGVAAYNPKNEVVIVIVTNFSDPIYPVGGLMFNLLSQIENL